MIGEYNNSGVAVVEYVYFGSRPVAVKVNGSLNIVHTDYLGTPRVITSGTNGGSVVWQWKNDNPYGSNKAQGTIEFNLRFAGQYYDKESGLHDNINRTYDPETGRYLQSDPIGLAGGFNTYNYVGKNPLNGVDPDGLYVRLMVVKDWNVGHVALDVNGMTYGLMPSGLRPILIPFNPTFDGYVKNYPVQDFVNHYTKGIWLDGHGYYDEISQYEISMSATQEKLLQMALDEKVAQGNVHYEAIPYHYNNCASFVTLMLNAYSGIDFLLTNTPDGTASYFDNLADKGIVKKLTTIYPKRH